MFRNRLTEKKSLASSEVDINLTPMLDVVFILLIFFIVTVSFIHETGMDVSLSATESATPQQASIRVSIDRHGEVWLEDKNIDIRTLHSMLKKIRLKNPQSAITIFADKASSNEILIKVLDQLYRAEIKNIAIAAEVDE